MSINDFLNKKIIVTQVRSKSKLNRKQIACVQGLGLRGINSTSTLECSPSVAGMIKKVEHIVTVQPA